MGVPAEQEYSLTTTTARTRTRNPTTYSAAALQRQHAMLDQIQHGAPGDYGKAKEKRTIVDLTAEEEPAWEEEEVPKKKQKKSKTTMDEEGEMPKKKQKKSKTTMNDEGEVPKTKQKKTKTTKDEPLEEKRLKRFKPKAPLSYGDLYERAITQRMFVLSRTKTGTAEVPSQTIELAGSTGNIYTVVIDRVLSCNCPHASKGNHCKHVVYVMVRTLKAPAHLQYQTALLSSELRDIFAKAPLPSETASADDTSGLRKPIEDDCPICCVEFDVAKDAIVWCKAACGNNIHKDCFEKWAVQKRAQGGGVTCPFCRTEWQGDEQMLSNISKQAGKIGAEGYVNVADQLGISGRRDVSTYHSYWVRREQRAGRLQDAEEYYEDYYE